MEQLIKYLNNLWTNTLSPTIKSHWDKADKRTDRLIESVRDDISINNPNDISSPIVEAQNATIEAIKNIPRVDIPKTDLVSLESKLDTINKTLRDKKMEVNVGETKLELTPVIKAIEKIKLEIPKMERQEVIDYTLILDEICVILEKPKDFTEIKKVQELLKPLSKTKDIAVVCEYLQTLIDKPIAEFPELPMRKGRLLVEVDRVGGGGGGGLTSVESEALQNVATEAKQDPLASYKDAGMDIASNPMYLGFIDINGAWYIKKLDTDSGSTFCKGDSDYPTAWEGKEELTYGLFNNIF